MAFDAGTGDAKQREYIMKGVCSAFWVSLLTLAQLTAQEAPWEKTAGPPGVEVRVIYKANNIFYAGTATLGVYRSTDNGMSWSPANHGIERTNTLRCLLE